MPERLYWDVPQGVFAVADISDAAFDSGLAAGTYQDPSKEQGDALIFGLGQPAPPLVLTGVVVGTNPMRGNFDYTGGHAAATKVSYYFGDGVSESRTLPGDMDAQHEYDEPGRYVVQAINNFGQRSAPVAVVVPYVAPEVPLGVAPVAAQTTAPVTPPPAAPDTQAGGADTTNPAPEGAPDA